MQFRDVENYTKPRLFPQVNLKNTIFQNKLFICGFKEEHKSSGKAKFWTLNELIGL